MNKGTNNRRSRGRGGNKRPGNVRNQNFDSNGPGVKVRGSAQQVLDKYLILARDASSAGDRIAAESYFQYAEHYFRLLNTEEQRNADRNQANRGQGNNRDRGETPGGSEGGPEDTHGVLDDEQPEFEHHQGASVPRHGQMSASDQGNDRGAQPVRVEGGGPVDRNDAPVRNDADISASGEGRENANPPTDDGGQGRPVRGRRKKAPDIKSEDAALDDATVANDAAD